MEVTMILVAYYVVLVLVGDLVAVVLCLWIERYWPTASLAIFLAFYFIILWVAWKLAVRLSEPKASMALKAAPPNRPSQ
jgi:hypothetical protein